MATLRSTWMNRARKALGALALGALAISSSGCKLLPNNNERGCEKCHPSAPTGVPCEACTYWDNNLKLVPDPQHNFQMSSCLLGRMILFGKKQHSVCADGTLVVTMYDDHPAHGGPPVTLEVWTVNKENLRKMIVKDDLLGMWGYTLALPTATCNPNMSQVRMELVFHPENSSPIYVGSSIVRPNFTEVFRRGGSQMTPANYLPGQPPMGVQPMPGAGQAAYVPQYQQNPAMGQPSQPANNQAFTQQAMTPAQAAQQPMAKQTMQPMPSIPQSMSQQPLAPVNYRPQQATGAPVVGQIAMPVNGATHGMPGMPLPTQPATAPNKVQMPQMPQAQVMPGTAPPVAPMDDRQAPGERGNRVIEEQVSTPQMSPPQLLFQGNNQRK